MRNIHEHWFTNERDPAAERERRAVLKVMTGWDDSKMKLAQASEKATQLKAEAMTMYFLRTRTDPQVAVFDLPVFDTGRGAS